jgi:hypothetical protein
MAPMVVVEDELPILVRLRNDRLPREILEEIQAAYEQDMPKTRPRLTSFAQGRSIEPR